MKFKTVFPGILLLISFLVHASDGTKVEVANFSSGSVSEWEEKSFKNNTYYNIVKLDSENVLQAVSNNSASGLVKEIRVDLKKHPYLNWKWRIENRLSTANEKIKSGDDYAVRVYIVIDGGLKFWKTKALSYVWANGASTGETWPNAFAGENVMMMALKSSNNETSTWYTEKRNVYEDLKTIFGEEFNHIDAISLMTDTDNSHGKAKSYYGDIYFSKE